MPYRLKLLKLVRKDNVTGLKRMLQNHLDDKMKRLELNFKLDGTTLLHEAISAEMIFQLIISKMNIMVKNAQGKSPEHCLKKKIKALAKEKSILKKEGSKKKIKALNKQIYSLKNALKMLKIVRTIVMTDKYNHLTNMDAYVVMRRVVQNSHNQNMTNDILIAHAVWASYHAKKTKNYIEKTKSYLENAGFDKEKIKEVATLIQMNNSNIYLTDRENKHVPKLLYRGTIDPLDTAKPLSHFGSFKAARERLNNLEEAIYEGKSENLARLGVDFNTVFFQIKPIFLKMNNPFRIPELGNHELKDYKRLMVHVLLMKEKGRECIDSLYKGNLFSDCFRDRLLQHQMPKEFSYIFDEPYKMDLESVKKELEFEGLYTIINENSEGETNINREHLCYQRMIRFFERQGYDGFVYQNGWEDVGEDSYICFRPSSVLEPLKVNENELYSSVQMTVEQNRVECENKKIERCSSRCLSRQEVSQCFDHNMRFYYGRQIILGVQCIKKTHNMLQRLLMKIARKVIEL